jgi:acyl dehydratase
LSSAEAPDGWSLETRDHLVERGHIARMAVALADPNPWWVDAEAARALGLPDLVAPPTFVDTYNPFYAGTPYPFDPGLPYSFSASDEIFCHEPVVADDVLSVRTELQGVRERPRRDGDGVITFATYEKSYVRQRDDVLVARWVWTGAYFGGKPSALSPRDPEPVDPSWTPLPTVTTPMTTVRFVRWAGAIGDYEPVHYDADYARGTLGLGGVVGQGALSMALLARVVTDWLDDPRRLRRLGVRYVANSRPGEVLEARGWVTGQEGDGLTLRLDLVDPRGHLVTTGTADVAR